MIRPTLLPMLLAALVLASCSQAQRAAETKVAALLRDPVSAQFRGVEVRKSGAVCGEVNAKNGFGGYVGFKEFVVTPDGQALIDPGDPSPPATGQPASVEQIRAAGDAFEWLARRLEWCVNRD